MKRIISCVLIILFLFGCSKNSTSITGALNLRQDILKGEGCSFTAKVTVDYSDCSYSFTVDCHAQNNGSLEFSIASPDSISGIIGSISEDGGKLLFNDQALLFEPLVNGQLSPAIAPWIMVEGIKSGYIQSGAKIKGGYEYCFNDSFQSESIQMVLTVNALGDPVFCEIFWHNSRILSIEISNYRDL